MVPQPQVLLPLAPRPFPSVPGHPASPQPVVRAAHLSRPQFGHEDAKDANKDEKINLQGETEAEPAASCLGGQEAPSFPGWGIPEDGLEEAGSALPR